MTLKLKNNLTVSLECVGKNLSVDLAEGFSSNNNGFEDISPQDI